MIKTSNKETIPIVSVFAEVMLYKRKSTNEHQSLQRGYGCVFMDSIYIMLFDNNLTLLVHAGGGSDCTRRLSYWYL